MEMKARRLSGIKRESFWWSEWLRGRWAPPHNPQINPFFAAHTKEKINLLVLVLRGFISLLNLFIHSFIHKWKRKRRKDIPFEFVCLLSSSLWAPCLGAAAPIIAPRAEEKTKLKLHSHCSAALHCSFIIDSKIHQLFILNTLGPHSSPILFISSSRSFSKSENGKKWMNWLSGGIQIEWFQQLTPFQRCFHFVNYFIIQFSSILL